VPTCRANATLRAWFPEEPCLCRGHAKKQADSRQILHPSEQLVGTVRFLSDGTTRKPGLEAGLFCVKTTPHMGWCFDRR
jgi:hypothetical protein